MKVVVASKNPVKVAATKKAFEDVFKQTIDIFAYDVPSGVSEQPKSDEESLRGALNRVEEVILLEPNADYYVGIEAGIEDGEDGMESFSWQVVANHNKKSKTKTQTIFLIEPLAELIRQGYELGHAIDKVFNKENSKQKQGAVGVMTQGLVSREKLYYDAIVLALIDFNIAKNLL